MTTPSCCICLNPFSEKSEVVALKCGHCFNRHCIQAWFRTSHNCPKCRKDATPTQTNRLFLSFVKSETIVTEVGTLLEKIETQGDRIRELENQMKIKDLRIENLNKSDTFVQKMHKETKSQDEIMDGSFNVQEKLENELMELRKKVALKERALVEMRQKCDWDLWERRPILEPLSID